jgi:hypothetical protein
VRQRLAAVMAKVLFMRVLPVEMQTVQLQQKRTIAGQPAGSKIDLAQWRRAPRRPEGQQQVDKGWPVGRGNAAFVLDWNGDIRAETNGPPLFDHDTLVPLFQKLSSPKGRANKPAGR